MREEFLEPLPDIQTKATLVFGKIKVQCFIVDVTVEEFRVAVPGAEHYEGDPRLLLISGDVIYPVRIVLQEAHAGGYSYRLQRTESAVSSGYGFLYAIRERISVPQCCAAGLVAALLTGFCCLPNTNERFPLLSLQGIRKGAISMWSPSVKENDRVPPGISVDNSLAVRDLVKRDLEKRRAESAGELQTVSVSMVTPASMSSSDPALLPVDESVNGGSAGFGQMNKPLPSAKKRAQTLLTMLDDGQVGRLQTVSPKLIPWLFTTAREDEFGMLRISDAAWNDLQQFELGLHELPRSVAKDAINNLRRTLKMANSLSRAKTVRGARDVLVVGFDDANVYFRSYSGSIEIVRVLPVDLNGAE